MVFSKTPSRVETMKTSFTTDSKPALSDVFCGLDGAAIFAVAQRHTVSAKTLRTIFRLAGTITFLIRILLLKGGLAPQTETKYTITVAGSHSRETSPRGRGRLRVSGKKSSCRLPVFSGFLW